jgi:hypothetical protein
MKVNGARRSLDCAETAQFPRWTSLIGNCGVSPQTEDRLGPQYRDGDGGNIWNEGEL